MLRQQSRDRENDKTTIRINTNCLLRQHNLGDKQTRFCFEFCFLPAKRVVMDRSVSVARPPKGLQARKTEKRCFSIELWSSDPPLRRNYDPQTSLVKGNHWTKPERSLTPGMVWLHAAPPRGGWEWPCLGTAETKRQPRSSQHQPRGPTRSAG